MTREEAIHTVQECRQYLTSGNPIWDIQTIDEAFRMAIESLQREEAEEKGWCHRIRPKNVEVVVRCKDCRYYECGGLPCPLDLCESLGDDGFCSRGERREP